MPFTVYTEKEKLTVGEERPLVVLNLSLPRVKEESSLTKGFTAYYAALREGFLRFAKDTLAKKAASASGEGFKPYGAVLSTVVSYDGAGLVSLYEDASVTVDGERRTRRISQLWRKDTGTIVKASRLFERGWSRAVRPLLVNAAARYGESTATPLFADWERQVRERFSGERFYLTPKGAVFYYEAGELSTAAKCVPLHLPLSSLLPLVKASVAPLLPKEE